MAAQICPAYDLHQVVTYGYLEMFDAMRQKNLINDKNNTIYKLDKNNKPAIYYGILWNRVEIVKSLLDCYNVDKLMAPYANGMTMLHYAAIHGGVDICQAMLAKLAIAAQPLQYYLRLINYNYCQTPLHYAAQHNSPQVYKLFWQLCDKDTINMLNDKGQKASDLLELT